jgi:hypothetical protein
VAYEVLCRRHHMRKVVTGSSKEPLVQKSSEPLPFQG